MASYATADYADQYFAGRLYAEKWQAASDMEKEAALQEATRRIDRMTLAGRKSDPEQENSFPRYPDTEVPQSVRDACCEEAISIMERGDSERRKMQLEGVQSFSIGGLSETFVLGAERGLLSQEAKELLRPWRLGAVPIT